VIGPHYWLDLSNASSQRFQVELKCTPQTSRIKLQLPVWTPGSYLDRAYARHLEGLVVFQADQQLCARRLTSSSWLLIVRPGLELSISYGLLAVEASVRSNWLDQGHGFLTAAAWALEVEGQRWFSHTLSLKLPLGWQVATSLSQLEDGIYKADNYDQLIDCPIALGAMEEITFDVGGVPHRWVWQGLIKPAPLDQWRWQLPLICSTVCRLMGVEHPPASGYLFMIRFCLEGFGGLEHDNNTALIFSRNELNTPAGVRRLFQLVAHEYLHQWNVRRLRPRELTPYNYSAETITTSLWFAEGITSYYDSLLILRAGLCSNADYFDDLGKDINRYLCTPGKAVQSLVASSEEAWIKLYRRDAHSDNQQISYYLKGQLVALLLDIHLLSKGFCLGQLLQELWQRFGVYQRGYSPEDLLNAAAKFDDNLLSILPIWLNSIEDLPLESNLLMVGMRLASADEKHAFSGIGLELNNGELRICKLARDSPGESAGLCVGDEILAIDGERCRSIDFFDQYLQPKYNHRLVISHDGCISEMLLCPSIIKPLSWSLVEDPDAPSDAIKLRCRWLQGYG